MTAILLDERHWGFDKRCSNVEITSHLICITHWNDETDPVMNNKFTPEQIEKTDSLNGQPSPFSPFFGHFIQHVLGQANWYNMLGHFEFFHDIRPVEWPRQTHWLWRLSRPLWPEMIYLCLHFWYLSNCNLISTDSLPNGADWPWLWRREGDRAAKTRATGPLIHRLTLFTLA